MKSCLPLAGTFGKSPAEGKKIEPDNKRNGDFCLDQNGLIRYILPSFSLKKILN